MTFDIHRGLTLAAGITVFILTLFPTASISADDAFANRDSIAVIIGNRNYSDTGINVEFAHNDADAMRAFVIDNLGYQSGNIIFVRDATLGKFQEIFGNENNPRGQLWNWSRKGRSNIFVYYSGHGAPDINSRKAFLIPTDVSPERASNGYALDLLNKNLGLLKAYLGPDREVVLMLDACFSGQSGGGSLLSVSGGFTPKIPSAKNDIIRLSASTARQVANWSRKQQLGLFTSVFLDAVRGEADKGQYGNANNLVEWPEITSYIDDEVRYRSRRYFSRNQTPEIAAQRAPAWKFSVGEGGEERKARICREEAGRWEKIRQNGDFKALSAEAKKFTCETVKAAAQKWLASRDVKQRGLTPSNRSSEINVSLERELEKVRKERQRLEDIRKQAEEDNRRRAEEIARQQREKDRSLDAQQRQSFNYSNVDPRSLFSVNAIPSFDCSKYGSAPQHKRNPYADILCIDPIAAAADYQMGQVYRQKISRLNQSRRRQLLQSQKAWIAQRDAACTASWLDVVDPNRRTGIVSCLVRWTNARIQQLQY